jgi:hypothetical protein
LFSICAIEKRVEGCDDLLLQFKQNPPQQPIFRRIASECWNGRDKFLQGQM